MLMNVPPRQEPEHYLQTFIHPLCSFPLPFSHLPAFPSTYTKNHYAEFCVNYFFPCFAIVYSIHEKLGSCLLYENSNVLYTVF